jgi:arylsulfatase A-like enzyme
MKLLILLPLVLVLAGSTQAATTSKPNVIVILADDLGYGDLRCYNPESKIPTPHLDRLAAEGIRFTDAHTPSAVCSPTRYGLMTGRYAWRTWLKSGVLDGFDPPLIERGRPTLASFLKTQGYATACIGKWHLGMTWTTKDGQPVPYRGTGNGAFRPGSDVDFNRDVEGGPCDVGFDMYFGIAASLDMSPYAFIEGRRPIGPVSEATEAQHTLVLNQIAGMQTPGFKIENVLPALISRAVAFVEAQAPKEAPFFIYLPLNSPHLPVAPSKEWQGKSGIGDYGDFVAETDAGIGRLLATLDRLRLRENTVVLFTSDNGGLWHTWKPQEADDLSAYKPTPRGTYNAKQGHHSNAHLRGTKADIYEGGHRVPFIVRWPGKIPAGTQSPALIELNDWFATLAEITGAPLPASGADDSISFAASLSDPRSAQPSRRFAIHHSRTGVFALREGNWKFVPSRGSGGFSQPQARKAKFGEPVGQLYNLAIDPTETKNVWLENPEVVARMSARLSELQASERTRR